MKKIALLGFMALGLAFTSCKKDYTCSCTVSTGNVAVVLENVSKGDAETACDASQTTYQIVDPNASCTLD